MASISKEAEPKLGAMLLKNLNLPILLVILLYTLEALLYSLVDMSC